MLWLKFNVLLLIVGEFCIASAVAAATNRIDTESSTPSSSPPMTGSSSYTGKIFNLPSEIDEDELLHQVGLFMLSNMNLTMDPCENFYEYACGNWQNSPRVPVAARTSTHLMAIQMEVNKKLIQFLERPANDSSSSEAKTKQFYKSCLSSRDIALGIKTLLENEKDLDVPTNSTAKLAAEWIILNFMSPYGVYPLLPVTVNYSTASRELEIFIAPPSPALERFANQTKSKELFSKLSNLQSELKLMLEFEKNLTSKVSPCKTHRNERTTLRDFLDLHKNDSINWQQVFNEAFPKYESDGNDKVWYVNYQMFNTTDFERFLRKSKSETLRYYIKWRTILKFYSIWKTDLSDEQPLQEVCLRHTENYFSYALMPWFITTLYDTERREDSLMLGTFLLENFIKSFDLKYDWLDEETRSNAKAKLRAMDFMVGYEDEWRHVELANKIYADSEITANWFKNLLNLEAAKEKNRINSVHKTVVPTTISPYSVNAFYAAYINTVYITMGISQMPLYHPTFPASIKFGGIGNLMAHEMIHGFDNNGYHMNYDGKNQMWMSDKSYRNFRERYQCLENQYNKFIYLGVATNASITMPDNIADNGGARLAYNSYKQYYGQREGALKPLPGVNFTNNELFFIKLAQTWCSGHDSDYKIQHISTDLHADNVFRVLGPFRNMPEFSQTFRCHLGSRMNPLKKCIVW